MSTQFEKMISDLSPKREPVKVGEYVFFARPMTVSEFGEFYMNSESEDRNDMMILKCIQNKDGSNVFENIEQVKSLYTTIRAQLAGSVSKASIMVESANEIEKE